MGLKREWKQKEPGILPLEKPETGYATSRAYYTILWYGMEGKNQYGIWNGSSMEWKIWCMEWNKSSIFHTNSILAHLTWCCWSPVFLSVEHISKQSLSSNRTAILKLRAFFVISVTNSNVDAKRRSLILILFSWGKGTLSPDFCMFTSVLPACHCVRQDSYLASIASNVAL